MVTVTPSAPGYRSTDTHSAGLWRPRRAGKCTGSVDMKTARKWSSYAGWASQGSASHSIRPRSSGPTMPSSLSAAVLT